MRGHRGTGKAQWWLHVVCALLPILVVASLGMSWQSPIASASQTECFSYGYACTPGYEATNTAGGWAWKYYGGAEALNANGYHNCTLYAAWRLEQNGLGNPGLWGNAFEWINHTPHNGTPAVGSIAWWGGGFGHVAYVDQISGGSVHVVADNFAGSNANGYTDSGWIPASSVEAFLHPHDVGGSGVGEGSFVSHDGFVYRIAGGSPLYVSSWNAVGGAQPTTALSDSEFAALPQYPRNGTVLDASGGRVFVVAGGAPLYVSNWAAIGGPKSGIGVDEAAVDNAGAGVPWDHLRRYPADGTLLGSSGGGVFVVAGGAPLYVSNWAAIGGPQSVVSMDQWDIDNTSDPHAHLRQYPSDGTVLGASGGGVFVVAGGAPLYVSNWAAIGGPQAYVAMDQWDIENAPNPAAHLRPYPADGTFLNTSTGRVFKVAGGAPFAVSGWSVFGGEQPSVKVDEWDLENLGSVLAHLSASPADGTLVEALPSGTFWEFTAARRQEIGANPSATTVDDYGLLGFPESATAMLVGSASPGASSTSTGRSLGGALPYRSAALRCVVPNLRHLTLSQARKTLTRANCSLGKVRHLDHRRTERVKTQSPRPHTSYVGRHRVSVGIG